MPDGALNAVHSYAMGAWVPPGPGARTIHSAVTGQAIASAGNDVLDITGMRAYARANGAPALRAMSFHDRARMLKALAVYLREHREELYELSYDTGATLSDHKIDVDGGIGTVQVYASKARRELPDGHVWLDGAPEQLGRAGQFFGQHVFTPLRGTAVHINAFNFPVWGMLEKLAPTLLAGMPAIIKPATATSYVTEACVRLMVQSECLPEGAIQLISGNVGNLLDTLDCQDVVTFTGSAATANALRATPNLLRNSVRFTAEQDSLNATLLGPDVTPSEPEFDVFVSEVVREMTVKAGQKCTAIRRILVPEAHTKPLIEAVEARLKSIVIGHPRNKATQMGALVSLAQRDDVLEKARMIAQEATRIVGDPDNFSVQGADREQGAFVPPMLFHCADPKAAKLVHEVEAFGPVATVMPYETLSGGIELMNKGGGSLVASVVTNDPSVARSVVSDAGAFHGRLFFNNATSAPEATGHGAPLPHMVHGGPGRAGGGEELGGIRAVKHFMQRTAIQGSPDLLTAIGERWVPGGQEHSAQAHPFTRSFNDLALGETLCTDSREITMEDIEHFAHFTGDTFYAHMDEEAARANPFFPGRVAHGYLLLSFAAGLFVQPDPGPVLANTGLDALRFMKPVQAGDSIKVRLTVKAKTPRNEEYGEVRWHVTLTNQDSDTVAEYELLTMNAF